jgi:hypothetical protein
LQYLNPKLPVLTLVKYALTGFEDLKATPKLAITPQIVNPTQKSIFNPKVKPTQKSIFNPKVKHTTPLLFSTRIGSKFRGRDLFR